MSAEPKPPHPFDRLRSHLTTGPRAIALRWIDVAHRRLFGSPIWALSEVTPNLLLGGQHYYRMGYQRLLDYGISAIVNMRAEHSDLDKGMASERHLQLATTDNTPPKVADIVRGVAFIDEEIKRGGKVYIHCAVGCGRAPTMTAAYLISTGDTPEQALTRVKAVRPFINLTARQKLVLDEFAASLVERRGADRCQD